MKPTPSQDGLLRFNINITVRAGIQELTAALCYKVANGATGLRGDDETDMPSEVAERVRESRSRAAIIAALREAVESSGDRYEYWGDHIAQDICDELHRQASAAVAKAFPELDQKHTTQHI